MWRNMHQRSSTDSDCWTFSSGAAGAKSIGGLSRMQLVAPAQQAPTAHAGRCACTFAKLVHGAEVQAQCIEYCRLQLHTCAAIHWSYLVAKVEYDQSLPSSTPLVFTKRTSKGFKEIPS